MAMGIVKAFLPRCKSRCPRVAFPLRALVVHSFAFLDRLMQNDAHLSPSRDEPRLQSHCTGSYCVAKRSIDNHREASRMISRLSALVSLEKHLHLGLIVTLPPTHSNKIYYHHPGCTISREYQDLFITTEHEKLTEGLLKSGWSQQKSGNGTTSGSSSSASTWRQSAGSQSTGTASSDNSGKWSPQSSNVGSSPSQSTAWPSGQSQYGSYTAAPTATPTFSQEPSSATPTPTTSESGILDVLTSPTNSPDPAMNIEGVLQNLPNTSFDQSGQPITSASLPTTPAVPVDIPGREAGKSNFVIGAMCIVYFIILTSALAFVCALRRKQSEETNDETSTTRKLVKASGQTHLSNRDSDEESFCNTQFGSLMIAAPFIPNHSSMSIKELLATHTRGKQRSLTTRDEAVTVSHSPSVGKNSARTCASSCTMLDPFMRYKYARGQSTSTNFQTLRTPPAAYSYNNPSNQEQNPFDSLKSFPTPSNREQNPFDSLRSFPTPCRNTRHPFNSSNSISTCTSQRQSDFNSLKSSSISPIQEGDKLDILASSSISPREKERNHTSPKFSPTSALSIQEENMSHPLIPSSNSSIEELNDLDYPRSPSISRSEEEKNNLTPKSSMQEEEALKSPISPSVSSIQKVNHLNLQKPSLITSPKREETSYPSLRSSTSSFGNKFNPFTPSPKSISISSLQEETKLNSRKSSFGPPIHQGKKFKFLNSPYSSPKQGHNRNNSTKSYANSLRSETTTSYDGSPRGHNKVARLREAFESQTSFATGISGVMGYYAGSTKSVIEALPYTRASSRQSHKNSERRDSRDSGMTSFLENYTYDREEVPDLPRNEMIFLEQGRRVTSALTLVASHTPSEMQNEYSPEKELAALRFDFPGDVPAEYTPRIRSTNSKLTRNSKEDPLMNYLKGNTNLKK
ncbi:hypothetical protein PCASD_03609 [Puccinia coronata f. sp. avenae]|uniref:Uncharacterized protein n=1 Tax=Puccinia coronata f. sp. avenae TaxID=200324 RepID=A0A2N5T6C8_9BASI|nr:hypothetical protein PCASD_15088 [Puccinia coronata f. sp. avenae]PLW48115.1 hypothetical protein PCASD_03609 [Puccinia coronata f. sp. avenae]